VTATDLIKWVHLLAAATWTGGLLVLAGLIPTLRKAGADRPMLQAVARRFGHISWAALIVAVVTGISMVERLGWPWSRVQLKIVLVAAAAALALIHQVTARRTSPGVRGVLQAAILVVSVALFGAAVTLI
jgi:uncharacterized membrane protein